MSPLLVCSLVNGMQQLSLLYQCLLLMDGCLSHYLTHHLLHFCNLTMFLDSVDLAACIVSLWIKNVDVCYLDAAFCNKKSRPEFLMLLDSNAVTLHEPVDVHFTRRSFGRFPHMYAWIAKRKINCQTFNVIMLISWIMSHIFIVCSMTKDISFEFC